ncbi:hypothetical protein HN51_020115 [Arachis hypogaea]
MNRVSLILLYDEMPDFLNAKIDGLPVIDVIRDRKWLEEEFTEKVQKAKADRDMFGWQRGGVLIQKWRRSSAASTAVSIVDAIRSLITPTPKGDWFSTGMFKVQEHLRSAMEQG